MDCFAALAMTDEPSSETQEGRDATSDSCHDPRLDRPARGPRPAADAKFTIAVFTKNTTNPAYAAYRFAADQIGRSAGARIVHYVPKKPDNVDEQIELVEQVLNDRPDAVVFIPVDDVAMIDSVKKLNAAKIPVVLASNPLPGDFVSYVGADDFEIGYRQARYLFDKLGGKAGSSSSRARPPLPPTASACAATGARWPSFRGSSCSAPAPATTSSPTPDA